ncbi:MAG: hypothetical protein LBK71_05395, partial [Verrucomicrobiales bacterium]|nr:hypothetical protein [Verrucomicrobiales bacterium]
MSTQLIPALRRNYLPANEDHAFDWLVNFKTELPRFANSFNINTTRVQQLTNAVTVLTDTRGYFANAADLYHERVADKNRATWAAPGATVTIHPFTAPTGPTAALTGSGGALAVAVSIADEILKNPACTAEVKNALRLNSLPRHQTVAKPAYAAFIKHNQLTVTFTKGDFEWFELRLDHGTGEFEKPSILHHSPWSDPTPLPTGQPQIWRVQLIGYLKGETVGIPGD